MRRAERSSGPPKAARPESGLLATVSVPLSTAPADPPDPGDDACARSGVLVDPPRSERAQLQERRDQPLQRLGDAQAFVLDPQPQVDRDLVVARAGGVKPPGGFADQLAEAMLDGHVDVLDPSKPPQTWIGLAEKAAKHDEALESSAVVDVQRARAERLDDPAVRDESLRRAVRVEKEGSASTVVYRSSK